LVNYQSCYNSGKCARIYQGLKHTFPKEGAVFGYKGYCSKEDSRTMNYKAKNAVLGGIFFRNVNELATTGIAKNQFQVIM